VDSVGEKHALKQQSGWLSAAAWLLLPFSSRYARHCARNQGKRIFEAISTMINTIGSH
jgi:hypothetical protein